MSPIELRYVRDVERAHGLPPARRQARRDLDSGVRYPDNFCEAFRRRGSATCGRDCAINQVR